MNWMANAKHRVRIVEKRGRGREPSFSSFQKRRKQELQEDQVDQQGLVQPHQPTNIDPPRMNTSRTKILLPKSDSQRRSSDLVLLSPLQQMSRKIFDTSPPRSAAVEATPLVTTATKMATDTATSSFYSNQEYSPVGGVGETLGNGSSAPSAGEADRQELEILYYNDGQQCREDGMPLVPNQRLDEIQSCVQDLFEGAIAPLQRLD